MANHAVFLTAESVAGGQPDKVCDQISDAVLDEVLRQDPAGRVACETFVTAGLITVGGEITTTAKVDIPALVRAVVTGIGYDDPRWGMDGNSCSILNAVRAQSPDIAQGVDTGGAGDQGMMVGYACTETPELMPLPIMLARALTGRLAEVRRKSILPYLGPDGKAQVTVEYGGGKPVRVDTVVLSAQHSPDILDATGRKMTEAAREELIDMVIRPTLGKWADAKTKYLVNPAGRFVVGGPQSDSGMTGRQIIVDAYGGAVSHGGGAFSGKDPTKVDRSAAYMARHIAKNIVASGVAARCTVQLAYAIGIAEPVSLMVDAHGTGRARDTDITKAIRKIFPLTPRGIIEYLVLRRPIYRTTAARGHFGRRGPGLTWEDTAPSDDLRKMVGSAVGMPSLHVYEQ